MDDRRAAAAVHARRGCTLTRRHRRVSLGFIVWHRSSVFGLFAGQRRRRQFHGLRVRSAILEEATFVERTCREGRCRARRAAVVESEGLSRRRCRLSRQGLPANAFLLHAGFFFSPDAFCGYIAADLRCGEEQCARALRPCRSSVAGDPGCSQEAPPTGAATPALSSIAIVNAKVWTGDPSKPSAEALAVSGENIALVGSNEEVRRAAGDAQTIDAGGRLIIPGFIDTHVHFIDGGFRLSSVQLKDAKTREEFIARIKSYAANLPAGAWITGGEWDNSLWGGELPSANGSTLSRLTILSGSIVTTATWRSQTAQRSRLRG